MKWFDMSKTTLIPGFKALIVDDTRILGAKGYNIYSFCREDCKLKKLYSVEDFMYSSLSKFKLLKRFFRAEITGLYNLTNGVDLLIAKKGIFKRDPQSSVFKKCFHIKRGSRPLNLCITPENTIYFGEYFKNSDKNEVHVYKSEDFGDTWTIEYTFPKNSINHIHGVFYDPFTSNVWVTTGDIDDECIIGYTNDNFMTLTPVFQGGQEFRACNLLFFEDFIAYATDSQYIKNRINIFNRISHKVETVYEISGSGIYGGQCGSFSFFSSTIEPSKLNKEKYSHLYCSSNGKEWKELFKYKKDIWHKFAFQFGSIQFPRYTTDYFDGYFVFSGRALIGIDGKSVILEIDEEK